MIVNKDLFISFIEKIHCNGAINSCIIKQIDNKIICNVIHESKSLALKLETIGELDNNLILPKTSDFDIGKFIKLLKSFSEDKIEIMQTDKKLIISNSSKTKQLDLELFSSEHIENNLEKTITISIVTKIALDSNFIKDCIKVLKLIKSEIVNLELKGGILYFNIKGQAISNKLKYKFADFSTHIMEFELNANLLKFALENIVNDDNIMLCVNDSNSPIQFTSEKNGNIMQIIVAPFIKGGD